MNGTDLLADFKKTRSEGAFGGLVRQYTNLVYSVAKRRLSNSSLAQEVTQIVFIRLAKAAPNIRGDAELVAWLHRSTVNASIDLWRSENRRRAREEHAAAMQPDRTEPTPWNELAPVLDEALNELNDAERQVILLRFFDQKTMRDLGQLLGITEDAAKMRVSRAMEHLRERFVGRGVTCSASALGILLAERSVEAAPTELAQTLAGLRIAAPAAVGVAAILSGIVSQLAKMKVVAGLAVAMLIGGITLVLLHFQNRSGEIPAADAGQAVGSNPVLAGNTYSAQGAVTNADSGQAQNEPDPRKLLQALARARQRIASGEMEFQVASYGLDRPWLGTNRVRLEALFDDNRRRFESFGREYSYAQTGDSGTAIDARMQAEGLNQVAAVRAGLLKGFSSHHVTAYDGELLLNYWENDEAPVSTTIDDASKGTSSYNFDPRTLGLSRLASLGSTVENCLGYNGAKSIRLVGRETIEGVSTWHINVQSSYNASLDYWIDTTQPTRIIKHAFGADIVLSKYDEANPKNPIPVEVWITMFRNGIPADDVRFICTKARFNVAVPPTLCTLAGLGMKAGTEVIDLRVHRLIGYWTGTGLAEYFSSKSPKPKAAPERVELLALLDNEPGSPAALDAAQWLLLNTPDGPEVEQAAEVILRNHIRSTNLAQLCVEVLRFRHRSSRRLLEAVVEKNPSADVRGNACFTMATLVKEEWNYGKNNQATTEAEKWFERVVKDFGSVKRNGLLLADLAKAELGELRRLRIGQPAPELEGEDLDGQPMRLSDFRGKVVVLSIWGGCTGCRPDVAEFRKLLERLSGKAFAIVGLFCDDHPDRAKALAEESQIIWPSFHAERSGPIATTWHVHRWPASYVLDRHGIIRYRNLREDGELAQTVEKLLRD